MSAENTVTKETLDFYLKELAKEYRRQNGNKLPAEIVLVGGAAVIANYGFREMTVDIDAIIHSGASMREAIQTVGDRYGLPNGWLNADFQKTASYSNALSAHSEYYRTFSNVVEIRTVRAEYLVAMKLVSGRRYKKDLSDIVGVLYEQHKQGKALTMTDIDRAMVELYGSWDKVDEFSRAVLQRALESKNLPQLLEAQMAEETEAKELILEIDREYPDAVTQDNVNDIIRQALEKKQENP